MVLHYGKFAKGAGVGLCQLLNLIYCISNVLDEDEYVTKNHAIMMYDPLLENSRECKDFL